MPVSRYDQIRLFKRYQMAQLNYLLDKLASYPEAGGTVLDNTVIFANSELADPVVHSHENMPVLICGKAGGRIASAGIGLTAVAETPFAATGAEAALVGQPPTEATFQAAGVAAAAESRPGSDSHGPAEYKRAMVKEMVVRALRSAAARAQAQR